MATTDDGQLQKQVPGEPPPQTGNDSQPVTQDEQFQTPIADEPPPQPNDESDSFSNYRSIIIAIFTCIIISAGITILILWLVPPSITVYVESASLTSFNFSSLNLHHNLSVVLRIRNPSRISSGNYRRVQTSAYYGGKWFQWAPLDDFHLGRKSTTVLRAVMAGATPVDFGATEVELYSKQRKEGTFDLEVRLQIRERYRFWSSKSRPRWLYYKCWLPGLRVGGTAGFVRTKCK